MHNLNDKQIPKNIGPYQIIEKIGQGGLGVVYKCIDQNNTYLAVKILHHHLLKNKMFLGNFHKEIIIIASLNHRNIVKYIDGYFKPPNIYIVFDFIDGWSGRTFLNRYGKLPPIIALSIIFEILRGLDYLHLKDLTHADLSISNFLIDKRGRVLLTDFGFSLQNDIEDYKYYKFGTPNYHSPEHITQEAVSPLSDIYCIGLIFFELLTGEKAVPNAKNSATILDYMKKVPIEKIIYKDYHMQNKIRSILKKSMQIKPRNRYFSAQSMIIDCYKIFKYYQIRHTQAAVLEFLYDMNYLSNRYTGIRQNIYAAVNIKKRLKAV
jgi:serine/threonine protein kinase